MKIADFCGQDTGGQSYNLVQAIKKYTNHIAYNFRKAADYLNIPVEFQAPLSGSDAKWAREFLPGVDIVHCHNRYRHADGWGSINPEAKWILHQHGRFGKGQFPEVREADVLRGALRIVSTLNILKYSKEGIWFPAPINVKAFDEKRKILFNPHRKTIKIAHSPTNRGYKHTELLIKTIHELKLEGHRIELVLVENISHDKCLNMKADCDITFDQMYLGYGNSGLEGMAFGQATIAGCQDRKNMEAYTNTLKKHIDYVPFVACYPAILKDVLKRLIVDQKYREERAKIGRKYIEDFHDFPVAAKRAIGLYERILNE